MLTLPREMIMLFLDTLDLEEGVTMKTCENASHNELVYKLTEKQMPITGGSPPHAHDMAAANGTLFCDKPVPALMNSLKRHFRSGFT